MQPYIERVLVQANNWMVHSMALLQRSWLEFERRKTADRALLQMQALLDQHTARLTITQSTFDSINSAAPSHERLKYMYCIAYPAQYEFKRDLANKYLKYQVFSSALNLFKELQLWDDVVTCYQLMDKPQRAEMVVRERLREGRTPYMLTSLGDLTQQTEFYEEAWALSKGRFARAKRTLAQVKFEKKLSADCIQHLESALSVQPLVPRSWYMLGLACMHTAQWTKALEAFTRCVQQDMEIGEAWANMGAVFMELKEHDKALVSFVEALKQKRESWKIIENLIFCTIELEKWSDAMFYMNMLLEQSLKLKSIKHPPVHYNELRKLVVGVFSLGNAPVASASDGDTPVITSEDATDDDLLLAPVSILRKPKMDGRGEDDDDDDDDGEPARSRHIAAEKEAASGQAEQAREEESLHARRVYHVMKLEKLLNRLAETIDSDARLWDVMAVFSAFLNRSVEVKEYRMKEVNNI